MTADLSTVGIAIPVLDVAPYVEETLASIAALTIPFRAVLQDGGSRDGTVDIARRVVGNDSRFEIVTEADNGQADAINRVWERLTPHCQLVTWINGDDVLHPHGFAQAVDLAVRRPEVSAAYGGYLVIDADGLLVEFIRRPPRLRRLDLLYVASLVPGVATVCRSRAIEAVGGFDTELRYALDTDLFIRLSRHGTLRGVPQPTFSFREHDASKTSGHTAPRAELEAQMVMQRHRRLHGPAGSMASSMLRARYRLLKAVGARLPVERYGHQARYLQPPS